jgi:hypothetical protein
MQYRWRRDAARCPGRLDPARSGKPQVRHKANGQRFHDDNDGFGLSIDDQTPALDRS